MKIYTKTGDSGETGLFGGARVSKADLRVEAYGAVDELNASLGWAMTQMEGPTIGDDLRTVQAELFVVGADLSTPSQTSEKVAAHSMRLSAAPVARLESWIDRLQEELEPLTNFILPGGTPAAAALQVCRAVCRRAERAVVRLSEDEDVDTLVVVYLNRLSDLLFVLSRWVNAREGVPEPIWPGRQSQEPGHSG